VYTARRGIWADLVVDDGERIGRKRVERLMRQAGLSGLITKKWKATTVRVPGVRVADDLLDRDFHADAPNLRRVADITYLRTWRAGCTSSPCRTSTAAGSSAGAWPITCAPSSLASLQMALARRRPDPGLIWHSDQGSQFVSLAFGQQARAAGIAQSMGSKGDCFDNAVAESFFATIKKELVHRRSWPTKAELRTEVFDYIEVFYNRERRHSTLGQRAPGDYENSTLSPSRPIDAATRLPSPSQDQHHVPLTSGPGRLITPCPPKRGRSKQYFK
jgi:putative transposase